MGFRFTNTVPSAALNQTVVPVKIEALPAVRSSWQLVFWRARIRWPDMRSDLNPVHEVTFEDHILRELVSGALRVVEWVQRIKGDWYACPASGLIENIETDIHLAGPARQ